MKTKDFLSHTHRRFNPLTGEWILVSPGRLRRPWLGKVERPTVPSLPTYDPACYLCPGNLRANGEHNPDYSSTFVFDNDYSSLSRETPDYNFDEHDLIRAESEKGICRVICFSARHDLTLAEMDPLAIEEVVNVWREEYFRLGELDEINYVQIFENKGEIMGCSNPHPHCQIWAESTIPVEPSKEMKQLLTYKREKGSCLLCDYMKLESAAGDRIINENDAFAAVVPFWATWPFEALIIPKRHIPDLPALNKPETAALAASLKDLLVRYDNLFETSFPYSSGIHQAPTDGAVHDEWHFHIHFYPPLLRSATIKKFMVGYEMLANPQRDITAEAAAERLREMLVIHYKQR